MSQTVHSFVYKGPWVNWSHGRVLGSTLTLSERNGGLLTAFLATFVTAAGVACWRILSYTLHQIRARQEDQDVLHHQQQATFRNTGTPAAAAWQFVQLIWYWRKLAARPLARTLPVLLLALLNIVFWALASIFSSEVTRAAGNEVLVHSPHCGLLTLANNSSLSQPNLTSFETLEVNDTLTATTYSQACYGKTHDSLQCNQYARRSIPWKTNQNATCPFASDLCFYGRTAAYEMDTGRLDSHQALGIDARKRDRVQYRKVTTCSPIHTKNYVVITNDTNPQHVAYGDVLINFMFGGISGTTNYTYQYNMHSHVDQVGYELTSVGALSGDPSRGWKPISALDQTIGDISLFFLAPNSVIYDKPTTDPFYSATNPGSLGKDGKIVTVYAPDYDVSVMACLDQHQFCNPSTQKCTPLTGSYVLGYTSDELHGLGLNRAQYATAQLINAFIKDLTTYVSVHTRGANALRASDTVHDNYFQIGLPNNQWMTEVSAWYGISMAKLQQKIVQYATGPPYVPEGYNVTRLPVREGDTLCNNQLIRSTTGTLSFSVLGVAIILFVGTILIIMSLILDTVAQFIRKKAKRNEYKSLQWIVDEKLQLQRLAYEEAGQGQWSGGANSVPITTMADRIGLPRGFDMTHPRLSRAKDHAAESYLSTLAAVESDPSAVEAVEPDPIIPEAEGLIEQKEMRHEVAQVSSGQH